MNDDDPTAVYRYTDMRKPITYYTNNDTNIQV